MSIGTIQKLRDGIAWGLEAQKVINYALQFVRDASTTVAGLVKLATSADTVTGTATDTATTPAGVKAATDAVVTALKAAANTWSGTNNFTGALQSNGVSVVPFGKHKIWIPVDLMRAASGAAGPSFADVLGTDLQYRTLDFDQATVERAMFTLSMPSRWNEGTVTFRPIWTAAAGSGTVSWQMEAYAVSDDDAIPASHTTAQNSNDTLLATGDLHRGPESGNLTVGGTPAANDTVFFTILRVASDAVNDTLNADARLLGVELYYTTDAAVDAA